MGVSGPYVGAYNAFPIGTLNDDGYELSVTTAGQEINQTDAYGMTLVEAIYRGNNWKMRIRGLEYKTGLLQMLQMFGFTGAIGTLTPSLLGIGGRWTSSCNPLVLTAILANPPTSPQSLTALSAGLAPNSASVMLMTSKLREVPLEIVLLPYVSGVNNVPFTST